jgi:hypothetical protein
MLAAARFRSVACPVNRVPIPTSAATLELRVGGKLADTRSVSKNPPKLMSVHVDSAAGGYDLKWDTLSAPEDTHTYAVQVSTDNGQSWTTVAVGLKSPQFIIRHIAMRRVLQPLWPMADNPIN